MSSFTKLRDKIYEYTDMVASEEFGDFFNKILSGERSVSLNKDLILRELRFDFKSMKIYGYNQTIGTNCPSDVPMECRNRLLNCRFDRTGNLVISEAEKDNYNNHIFYRLEDDSNIKDIFCRYTSESEPNLNFLKINNYNKKNRPLEYIWIFWYYGQKNIYGIINSESGSIYNTDNTKGIKHMIEGIGKNGKVEKCKLIPDLQDYQDYYFYCISQQYGINFNLIIKLFKENKELELEDNFDVLSTRYENLFNKFLELRGDNSNGYFNTSNPFSSLIDNLFLKIKDQRNKENIIFTSIPNDEHNNIRIFDDIRLNIGVNISAKKIKLNIINEQISKLYNEKNISSAINLLDLISDYILVSQNNSLQDNIIQRLLYLNIELPKIIFNLLNQGFKISIGEIINLCKGYGNWIKLASHTMMSNIYKYYYLILINKLLEIEPLVSESELNQYLVEEFIIDVNQIVLIDISLIDDINLIKSELSNIKLWYWDNSSLTSICERIYKLIKSKINNDEPTTFDLNMDLDKINYDKTNDKIIGAINYFTKSSNYKPTIIEQDHEVLDAESGSKSTKLKKKEEYDSQIVPENKIPDIFIDINSTIFKFVKFNEIIDELSELDKLLILLQIVNTTKLPVISKSCYPNELPYTSKCRLAIINDPNPIEINRVICLTEIDVKLKTLEQYKKGFLNEFNTLKQSDISFDYINNFVNFVNTQNDSYIKSNINPFIKFGIEILNEINESNFVPVNYKNKTKIVEPSESMFKLKRNIFDLITWNNKSTKNFDLEGFERLSKLPANIYLFVYLYVANKKDSINILLENITLIKSKLYTLEEITSLNVDDQKKYILLSNNIKISYLIGEYEDLYKEFKMLLDDEKNVENKNEPCIKCDGETNIRLKYLEYQIPYLEIGSRLFIRNLRMDKTQARSYNQTLSDNKYYSFISEAKPKFYELDTFESTLKAMTKSENLGSYYPGELVVPIRANILYPKIASGVQIRRFGLYEGLDEDPNVLYNEGFDTKSFRPKFNTELRLDDILQIQSVNFPIKKYIQKLLNVISGFEDVVVSIDNGIYGEYIASKNMQYYQGTTPRTIEAGTKIRLSVNNGKVTKYSVTKLNPNTGRYFPAPVEFTEPNVPSYSFQLLLDLINEFGVRKLDDIIINENLLEDLEFQNGMFTIKYPLGTTIDIVKRDGQIVRLSRNGYILPVIPPYADSIFNKVIEYQRINIPVSGAPIFILKKDFDIEEFRAVTGTKIGFNFKNGQLEKYFIDGVRQSIPSNALTIYKLLNIESNAQPHIEQRKLAPPKRGGANPKMSEYFNIVPKEIEISGITLTKSIDSQTTKPIPDFKSTIIANLLYFLNKIIFKNVEEGRDAINYLSDDEAITFSYDDRFKDYVYKFCDYRQLIKRVYVGKEQGGKRKIYVTGMDLFKLYPDYNIHQDFHWEHDLVKIYNSSIDLSEPQNIIRELRDFSKSRGYIDLTGGTEEVRQEIKKFKPDFSISATTDVFTLKFNDIQLKMINSSNSLDQIRNMVFAGEVDSEGILKFYIPYYLENPIFFNGEYFNFNISNNIIEPTEKNVMYEDEELRFNPVDGKITNNKNEIYVNLSNINLVQDNFVNKILRLIENKQTIMCWKNSTSNQIVSIDILSMNVNFRINEFNQVIINNLDRIVLNLESIDWKISRWIKGGNTLLSIDDNCNFGVIILEPGCITTFKINKNTYLPIVLNENQLVKLINLYKEDSLLLKELSQLIVKYKLESLVDSGIRVNKFVQRYKGLEDLNTRISYYQEYTIRFNKKIIQEANLEELYYKNYYFPVNGKPFATLSEYMLFSLVDSESILNFNYNRKEYQITLEDLAFGLFYNKLKHLDRTGIKVKFNPLEFYYQYIFGFLALTQQNQLANEIFKDLVMKNTKGMEGGANYRMEKYFDIDSSDYETLTTGSQPRIHNLIMGGGKTSMITPLVIIKYIQYLTSLSKTTSKQNCYIVLPEKLVNPSVELLGKILNMYFPVIVSKCEESRSNNEKKLTYNKTLSGISESDCLNVYVLSDTSLKCGFINNYQSVRKNKDNHIYLFDEADTILNPITSELNYPIGEESKLENSGNYFNFIYCLYRKIYKGESTTLNKILEQYTDAWTNSPHFYIINPIPEFIEKLKLWLRLHILKYYEHRNPVIYELINNGLETIDSDIDISDLNTLYVLYNFMNEVFISSLSMVNRVKYGLETISKENFSMSKLLAIPFTYNENPAVGSKFSNPVLTLSLTIIDYIIQSKPLDDCVVSKIINVVKSESNISEEFKKANPIIMAYTQIVPNINIEDLNDVKQLTLEQIYRLKTNECLVYKLCELVCKTEIKIDVRRDNISGIDLFMSFSIENRVGFTGTSNIPRIVDYLTNKQIVIVENEETTQKITRVLNQKCQIEKYADGDSIDILHQVLEFDDKVNVVIDVGGVFVGKRPIDVYRQIIKVRGRTGFKQFVFWDDNDVPQRIDEFGNQDIWNRTVSSTGSYYYYDHKHTTGIDAVIPVGSVGAAFLANNSRYRDVVQSIFRMRKLEEPEGHSIKFILTDKLNTLVKTMLSLPLDANTVELSQLIDWFNLLEANTFRQQSISATIQNIKALAINAKIIRKNLTYREIKNKIDEKRARGEKIKEKLNEEIVEAEEEVKVAYTKAFRSQNNFKLFRTKDLKSPEDLAECKELVLGTITNQMIEVNKSIKELDRREDKSNTNTSIESLIESYNEDMRNPANRKSVFEDQTTTYIQTQTEILEINRIQVQQQEQEQEVMITRIIDEGINPKEFRIGDYFNYSNPEFYLEKIDNCVYVSVNLSLFNDANLYPTHVIYIPERAVKEEDYVSGRLLVIPDTEGFKIIDFMIENTEFGPEEFIIFDSTGLIYYSKIRESEETIEKIRLTQTFIKFIFMVYESVDSKIIIDVEDFVNFIKFIQVLNPQLQSNIIKHIKEIQKDIVIKYVRAVEYYLDPANRDRLLENSELNHFYKFIEPVKSYFITNLKLGRKS